MSSPAPWLPLPLRARRGAAPAVTAAICSSGRSSYALLAARRAGARARAPCSPAPSRRSNVAARDVCPAVLMGLWQEAPPRAAAWRFWFNAGTFTRRHLLAVRQRPRPRQGARLDGRRHHAGPGRHHGALRRAARLGGGALAAAQRRLRWLVGLPAAVAAGRMVARLVPDRLLLAVARLFADRHLARAVSRRSLGVYGISAAAARERRRAGRAAARHCARARRSRRCCSSLPWVAGALLAASLDASLGCRRSSWRSSRRDIPQDEKWQDARDTDPATVSQSDGIRRSATQLIVWPEAALPDIANNLLPYIAARRPRGAGPRLLPGHRRGARLGRRRALLQLDPGARRAGELV